MITKFSFEQRKRAPACCLFPGRRLTSMVQSRLFCQTCWLFLKTYSVLRPRCIRYHRPTRKTLLPCCPWRWPDLGIEKANRAVCSRYEVDKVAQQLLDCKKETCSWSDRWPVHFEKAWMQMLSLQKPEVNSNAVTDIFWQETWQAQYTKSSKLAYGECLEALLFL